MTLNYVAAALTLTACIYALWMAVSSGADAHRWRLRRDASQLTLPLPLSTSINRRRRLKETKNKKKHSSGGSSSGNAVSVYSPMGLRHDRWRTPERKPGLRLKVLNNLKPDSQWHTALATTVREWSRSNAVHLSIRPAARYDSSCNPTLFAIKVCNGDYGDSRWKAMTNTYFSGTFIVASRCKMNDFYEDEVDRDERQYTMCHEMGHALGLKHSDEDFTNEDLLDCMDYARDHRRNQSPGRSNFVALRRLYGNLNGGVRRLGAAPFPEEEEQIFYDEFASDAFSQDAMDIALMRNGAEGWRLLHKTDAAEYHARELGNGFSIVTSVLLA